jgi:hypothetical protein
MAVPEQSATPQDAVAGARDLWTGSFHAVLSTHAAAEPGYPFGSVVPMCLGHDGVPLLLLSHLAQHSRNLAADRRAALTLFDAVDGDIQQGRRLSCIGHGEPLADPAALDRYCQHFPDGRMYAAQLNFHLYRFTPLRCHYNGGFAQARWLGVDRLLDGLMHNVGIERVLARHLLANHGDWLATECRQYSDEPGLAGLDRLGITVRCGTRLKRIRAPASIAIADEAALTNWIADRNVNATG